jgi:hypothetical protein
MMYLTWRREMADQAAKSKRKKAVEADPQDVVDEVAEGIVAHLMDDVQLPALESVDQQRQRKKLQVMQELDDFRASFSRGYTVILTELARKRARE